MKILTKMPGPPAVQTVNMDFNYKDFFGEGSPEAYERLIFECMCGDATLFASAEEAFNSWKLFTSLINSWKDKPLEIEEFYEAGSFGPTTTQQLITPWRTA